MVEFEVSQITQDQIKILKVRGFQRIERIDPNTVNVEVYDDQVDQFDNAMEQIGIRDHQYRML